jgi:apolipoprotein N-acyltransferase
VLLKRHDQRSTVLTALGSGTFLKPTALILSLIAAGCFTAEAITHHARPWLSWFALIPIFVAIRNLGSFKASLCGALWGASVGVYSLLLGSEQISSILSVTLLTLVPGVYAYFGAHTARQRGFNPLILGLGWAGVEFALQPLGLRHGLLAGTQGDSWLLLLVGKIGGYVLVAFLVAFISATILSAVSRAVHATVPRSRPVCAAASSGFRVFLSDWFRFISRFVTPSQPRAPPVPA